MHAEKLALRAFLPFFAFLKIRPIRPIRRSIRSDLTDLTDLRLTAVGLAALGILRHFADTQWQGNSLSEYVTLVKFGMILSHHRSHDEPFQWRIAKEPWWCIFTHADCPGLMTRSSPLIADSVRIV